jgi:hypothetical protein
MGGSGPKSVGGSSWMNSELDENGKDTVVLDWFRPLEAMSSVVELCMNGEVPSNGALGRLIWPVG